MRWPYSVGDMIQLNEVVKRFDARQDVTALKGVSLRIDKGEMVSIVGPSGSGKSTLLNIVGCLDRPTSGDVSIGGERLDAMGDDALTRVRRDKIGFVFQFFNLLATLTAKENVALPLHLRGWSRRRSHERATRTAGRRGPGQARRPSAGGAVGRRAAARRDRPRAVDPPADPARRRADGQPRFGDGSRDPEAAAGRAHAIRFHGHPRDARLPPSRTPASGRSGCGTDRSSRTCGDDPVPPHQLALRAQARRQGGAHHRRHRDRRRGVRRDAGRQRVGVRRRSRTRSSASPARRSCRSPPAPPGSTKRCSSACRRCRRSRSPLRSSKPWSPPAFPDRATC